MIEREKKRVGNERKYELERMRLTLFGIFLQPELETHEIQAKIYITRETITFLKYCLSFGAKFKKIQRGRGSENKSEDDKSNVENVVLDAHMRVLQKAAEARIKASSELKLMQGAERVPRERERERERARAASVAAALISTSFLFSLLNKLGRGHRDKLQQFIAITGSSEKVALQALKASDWHLEGAFDVFYSQPQIKSYADSRHLEELYNRYKGMPSYELLSCLSH
ncbi:hypothetical protein Cgig2_030143 [Carnegiea gigantea]|uniref:Defective in cullin neddylation protein n=1 Tax=Carnegiea gigantea TaxID=171969 RepID=A0A9Q1QB84_9CARY|nr:hypothetical protein Cgig2_030143 [Carnegiea gigantea]